MAQLSTASTRSILTLPTEIIGEIFIACVDDGRLNPREAPLLLTRISSGLRRIAVNTPALWCKLLFLLREPRLHIISPQIFKLHYKTRIEGIDELIKRSRTLPLSITFVIDTLPRTAAPYVSDIKEFAQKLAALCAPRLRCLILSGQRREPPDFYNPFLKLHAPQLTILAIKNLGIQRDSADDTTYPLFSVHSLKELVYTDCDLESLLQFPICWENLTVLKLKLCTSHFDTETLQKVAQILRQTTHLVALTLMTGSVEDGGGIDIITLPCVKYLEVSGEDDNPDSTSITDYLRTPVLETLYIGDSFTVPKKLLQNSPLLRHLQLSGISDTSEFHYAMDTLLVSSPQITSFTLEWRFVRGPAINVLQIFNEVKDGILPFPDLCEFRSTHVIKTSFDALSRFLGITTGDSVPHRPWKSVAMKVSLMDWNEDIKQSLENFLVDRKKEGVDLQIQIHTARQ